jgi:HSP20 family protein
MSFRNLENWMWADACALLDKAERLQRQFFQLGSSYGGRLVWEPPADIFQTEREISICVALPGVDPDQIEVRLAPGLIVIGGDRPIPDTMRNAAIHRLEIPYGRFERSIALPPGRYLIGRQRLENGCVEIILEQYTDER